MFAYINAIFKNTVCSWIFMQILEAKTCCLINGIHRFLHNHTGLLFLHDASCRTTNKQQYLTNRFYTHH